MKRLIFGCTLMLCGAICSVGIMIAKACLVEGGAWSTLMNIFYFSSPECYGIILFGVVSIAGLIIAVKALREE